MRLALIGLLTVAAALAAGLQSGSAQESFFNERFCARGTGESPGSSFPDCSFRTWDQCIASARGSGRWCTTNPWWHEPRKQPTAQGKSGRRNR
jgi:hypothetical protein